MIYVRHIGALVLVAGTAACFTPHGRSPAPTEDSGGSSDGTASSTGPSDGTEGSSSAASDTTASADASTSSADTDTDTGADPVCGNGIPEPGEACDLGEATPECSLACTACEPPAPTSVLDQQIPVCEGGAYSDCRDGWSMANGQSGLQGVRVSQSGTLGRVELYVANEAVATTMLTVQIVDGGGNAPLFPVGATPEMLETAVVATATAPGTTDFGWVAFDFADAEVHLVPDRDYFLWLRMMAPFPDDPNLRLRWNLFASPEVVDPYTGGRSFFCAPGVPCDTQLSHWDFAFRVRLLPDPPLCE